MTRQDHQYVNLPRSLMEVVDTCVTNISSNGVQTYKTKKDFIINAIVQRIENEKAINRTLAKKIDQKEELEIVKREFKNLKHNGELVIQEQEQQKAKKRNAGGNRSKNV